MDSADPATVIIPVDLGTAATFDSDVFPLAYYEHDGSLNKGSFLIRATLEEMARIRELGIDLNENQDFIFTTRLKLEELNVERAKLQGNRKTLNPFKAFLNYRAARLFHASSRALYLQTKSTSEEIHGRRKKHMQVISSKQAPRSRLAILEAISPDARIGGVIIELPDGWNDSAERTINDATETIASTNPFQENSLISQLREGEQAMTLAESLLDQDVSGSGVDRDNQTTATSSDPQRSRPTSSQIVNHNHIHIIQNSVVTTKSNLTGVTASYGSQNISGASVTRDFAS